MYKRMPTVFGPFPGPRQSLLGTPRDGRNSTAVTATVTFLVPKERLQDLLPHPAFSWQSSDTNAYISVSAKRLDNLEWLAGRGYNLFTILVHGVQYRAKDGRLLKGTYIPILWEDLADPIISGREELGYPKLFADLHIEHDDLKYSMTASWQGNVFGKLSMAGLTERRNLAPLRMAPVEAGEDQGIFVYKYIPSVGQPGWPDVEYPVFISHAEEAKTCNSVVWRQFETQDAAVVFDALDWKHLPTLHHIIFRLSDLSLDKVVRATVSEARGVADFSSAAKL